MGYTVKSFYKLLDEVPRFKDSSAEGILEFYRTKHRSLELEAFLSIRIDGMLTKLCRTAQSYLTGFSVYEDSLKHLNELYSNYSEP